MVSNSPLIIALDCVEAQQALAMTQHLGQARCRVKVGKALFTSNGPALVKELQKQGFEVFLDLKFHDIPNTVAMACAAAAELGVWMVNVHALGGKKMLCAAREAIEKYRPRPLLIAVSILTSLSELDLAAIGMQGLVQDNVLRLAQLVHNCGLDGLVCSPKEIKLLRENVGSDFLLVTPGIRPFNATQDDQKRTLSPKEALEAGADYLVIGRPITAAANPLQALQKIEAEIRGK